MEQIIAFTLGAGLVVFIIIIMSTFRVNKTIGSQGAKIEELYDIVENFEDVLEELTNTLDQRIDDVEESIDDQIESLEKIIDGTEELLDDRIDALERSIDDLDRRIDSRADRIMNDFNSKFADSSTFADKLHEMVESVKSKIKK